jgi:hypothetical protein
VLNKERLLHPATIIAVIALLVALTGAGYAATQIGTAQLKNNAVTTAKLKNNAVTTAKLKNNAVTTAKLKNGAMTTAKIANGAVTGAKIAGATITAANIAPGQVVAGNGTVVTGRQGLATGETDTVLTLPGAGQLRASCAAGVTTISFLNQSGGTAAAHAWGVSGATAVSQQGPVLNGASTAGITAAGPTVLGLTYQVVSAANGQETTANISAGRAVGGSCLVIASGLT